MANTKKNEKRATPAAASVPVKSPICPHGNHFCVACEDCGRVDPRNHFEETLANAKSS